jgi:hypothetical protein
MTSLELHAIVDQRMGDPAVVGRLACTLRREDAVEQRHHDGRRLNVVWHDSGDFWRCTVSFEGQAGHRLAQIDLHENGTVRADVFEPCRVTVSPDEGLLCLTRYKNA